MPEDLNGQTTLEVLRAIEREQHISQRSLASRLGIALGLTNAYVKRCLKKGWIKMSRAPARRYAYYLTPQGFAEKSRLTAQYLKASFDLYRLARAEYLTAFRDCQAHGWNKLGLYGAGDLAEVAMLSARENGNDSLVLIDPDNPGREFLGMHVAREFETVRNLDAVLITTIETPQEAFDTLSQLIPADRIVTIPLLGVRRSAVDTQPGTASAGD